MIQKGLPAMDLAEQDLLECSAHRRPGKLCSFCMASPSSVCQSLHLFDSCCQHPITGMNKHL